MVKDIVQENFKNSGKWKDLLRCQYNERQSTHIKAHHFDISERRYSTGCATYIPDGKTAI